MDELEKLKKLLHHWMEHNDEHAESYRLWAEKAKPLNSDLSEVLERLHADTKRLNRHFEKALGLIK